VEQHVRRPEAGLPVVLIRAEIVRKRLGTVQQCRCGGPVLMARRRDGRTQVDHSQQAECRRVVIGHLRRQPGCGRVAQFEGIVIAPIGQQRVRTRTCGGRQHERVVRLVSGSHRTLGSEP
jgi:hypothetical protein